MNFLKSKMRILAGTMAVTLVLLSSCSKEKTTVISGQLSNIISGKLYISEFKLTSNKVIDSTEVSSNGKFKFKVKIKDPSFFQIKTSESNFILVLTEPGEKIKISGNMMRMNFDYTVEGSPKSQEVKLLTDKLNNTKFVLDSLSKIALSNEGKPEYKEIIARLDSQYIQAVKNQRKFSIGFILEHLSSMSSIVALYQQFDENSYVLNQNRDLQYVKLVSDTLLKYYPNSDIVKVLYTDRSRLLSELNRLRLSEYANIAEEKKFPDLELLSLNGDTVKLSKVKSKLVLLNYWMPENQESLYVLKSLQDIYKKYQKKGLEIYNVGLISNYNIWKSLCQKYDFAGIQVIDMNEENGYSLKIYNVHSLPACYLINESGIVDKNVFGENLDNRIGQLLR